MFKVCFVVLAVILWLDTLPLLIPFNDLFGSVDDVCGVATSDLCL